jgi:hypothetical protein
MRRLNVTPRGRIRVHLRIIHDIAQAREFTFITAPGGNRRRKLHKDWRVWLAVALMLAAMAMYVLSLDESVAPRIFGN